MMHGDINDLVVWKCYDVLRNNEKFAICRVCFA